jgi:hypothetical protein
MRWLTVAMLYAVASTLDVMASYSLTLRHGMLVELNPIMRTIFTLGGPTAFLYTLATIIAVYITTYLLRENEFWLGLFATLSAFRLVIGVLATIQAVA